MVVLKTKEALIAGKLLPEFELNQGDIMSQLVDSLDFVLILKDYLPGTQPHPLVELF